jgi:hypothetical protein
VRRLRERHEAVLAHFRQIAADTEEERARDDAEFPYLALEYGIEFMEWVSGWCRRMEERLTALRLS